MNTKQFRPLFLMIAAVMALSVPSCKAGGGMKVDNYKKPLSLGPVERIGGKRYDLEKKETKAIRPYSVKGIEGGGRGVTIIYEDDPEAFGLRLIQLMPGSNVHIRFEKIRAITSWQCYIICGNNWNMFKGKALVFPEN